jgi:uncharacterized membrane protein YphA (DoxX/SURF4 family)
VRRLFFTFANGPPGIGLLLLRLLAGSAAVAHGVFGLRGAPELPAALVATSFIGLALLLVVGLWTPLVGAFIAADVLWEALAHPGYRWYSLTIAVLGLALALLGPGKWSLDARLFGWKRL